MDTTYCIPFLEIDLWIVLFSFDFLETDQVVELEKEIIDRKVVHWRQCQVQKPLPLVVNGF